MPPDDRLGLISAFVNVAQRLNFKAAAKDLAITPSSLSRRVSRLEAELGVRLLQRNTRRVALTEAGQRYRDDCLRILAALADADAAVGRHAGAPTGLLRVSAPVAFGRLHIGPLLPRFFERYPQLRIDLDLTDRYIDLIAEQIDVAIRIGRLADSRLVARKLAANRRVLCAAPDYLKRSGRPATPAELAGHSCLNFSMLQTGDVWSLQSDAEQVAVPVTGLLRANNAEVLHDAVLGGCGIALLAEFIVAGSLRAGRLVTLLDDWWLPETNIYAVYPQARLLPEKVRAFVGFLQRRFGEEVDWARAEPLPG